MKEDRPWVHAREGRSPSVYLVRTREKNEENKNSEYFLSAHERKVKYVSVYLVGMRKKEENKISECYLSEYDIKRVFIQYILKIKKK